jgi:hypothetical protein
MGVEARSEKSGDRIPGEPRASHRWITINGQKLKFTLDQHCNLIIRERFARRGVTFKAEELAHKFNQHKGGVIFPEALVEGSL